VLFVHIRSLGETLVDVILSFLGEFAIVEDVATALVMCCCGASPQGRGIFLGMRKADINASSSALDLSNMFHVGFQNVEQVSVGISRLYVIVDWLLLCGWDSLHEAMIRSVEVSSLKVDLFWKRRVNGPVPTGILKYLHGFTCLDRETGGQMDVDDNFFEEIIMAPRLSKLCLLDRISAFQLARLLRNPGLTHLHFKYNNRKIASEVQEELLDAFSKSTVQYLEQHVFMHDLVFEGCRLLPNLKHLVLGRFDKSPQGLFEVLGGHKCLEILKISAVEKEKPWETESLEPFNDFPSLRLVEMMLPVRRCIDKFREGLMFIVHCKPGSKRQSQEFFSSFGGHLKSFSGICHEIGAIELSNVRQLTFQDVSSVSALSMSLGQQVELNLTLAESPGVLECLRDFAKRSTSLVSLSLSFYGTSRQVVGQLSSHFVKEKTVLRKLTCDVLEREGLMALSENENLEEICFASDSISPNLREFHEVLLVNKRLKHVWWKSLDLGLLSSACAQDQDAVLSLLSGVAQDHRVTLPFLSNPDGVEVSPGLYNRVVQIFEENFAELRAAETERFLEISNLFQK